MSDIETKGRPGLGQRNGSMLPRWIGGEIVTRQIYMDDGTWSRKGDKCLAKSPLRHGTVISRDKDRSDAVWVRWDDGSVRQYLDHGIAAEISSNTLRDPAGEQPKKNAS